MDYDENEFQGQNCNVSGEGSSKFSPVLHPYALSKFDFDDGLQGHLRFDNLVENEAFLGIQSQEDNKWIEDYSRGSGVFSSSAPEPCPILRSNNVWSEAASSESVEMLLNSVGQEETITIAEESDACQKLGSVVEQMDSHFKEDDNKMDVMDSKLTLVSEKVADHGSVLIDVEGMSRSPGVEITTHGKSHMSSPNDMSGPCGVHGIDDNLDSRNDEEDVCKVDTSLDKFPVNEMEDPSDFNMKTENVNAVSQHIIINTSGLDNQESVTKVTDADLHSANCLLTGDVKDTKEDDIVSEEVNVDGQVLNEIASETVGEKLKNLSSSSSNSEIVELRPVEINASKLDRPPGFAVMGSGDLHIAESDENVEFNKGSESYLVDLSIQTQIHRQFDENIQNDLPKDFQSNGDFVSQAVEVITEKVEISAGSELNVSRTAEVSNSSAERNFSVHVGDCQLGLGVSIRNNQAPALSSLKNDASEGDHSIEKSKVGDDAFGIQKETSAEDGAFSPTVSGLAILASNPNPVHPDLVVSANGEEKPLFPNDSSEMKCDSVDPLNQEKRVEIVFDGNSNKHESVCGSESDAATSTEPDVTPENHSSLYEVGANVDLAVDQMGENPKNEKASYVETNLTPLKDTSQSTYEMDPVPEFGKGSAPNSKAELSQEAADHSLPVSGTLNTASDSEQTRVFMNVTAHQSSKVAESPSTGILSGQAKKKHQISGSPSSKLELFPSMHEPTTEQKSDADAPDILENHEATGKDYRLAPSKILDSDVSTSTTIHGTKDENEEMLEQSLVKNAPPAGSVKSALKEVQQGDVANNDKSFTFHIDLSSAVVGEYGQDKQPMTPQSSKSYKEVSPSAPSVGPTKSAPVLQSSNVSSQALDLEIAHGGSTVTPARKRGRPSGKAPAKQSAKKRSSLKETIPFTNSGNGDNRSSVSMSLSGAGQLQFEAVKLHEKFQQSSTVSYAGVPVATPNLPDLNSSVSPSALVRQQFTDIQQMQLRAQIFVYGSLIQGAAPDETCMVAAFGTSDGGRSTWEPVWRACVEKLQGAKSNLSKSENTVQPQSGHPPEQTSTKKDALQSSLLSSPVFRASSKGTPSPVVNTMIPLSSPLWTGSTPFLGLQSVGLPRNNVFDHRQTLSPSHLFQTPPPKNVTGNSSSWLPHASFPAPWVNNASQASPFDGSARLPTTETVKLTPIKEPAPPVASGATHSFPSITVHHSGPGVSAEPYTLPDVKKLTMSSGQKTAEPKSRKRKKSIAAENVNQILSPAQARIETVHAPVPLFAQARTEFIHAPVPAPVIPTHLSTSVVVSTPPFFGSKGNDTGMVAIASPSYLADQTKIVEPNTEPKSNLPDNALDKAEVAKQPAKEVNKTTMISDQKTAEPKSRRRKKSIASENVNQISFPAQAQIESLPSPLPLFAQARTDLVPAPVPAHVSSSHLSTPVVSIPFFGSKGFDARVGSTASPSYLADQPKRVEPNTEQKSNLPVDALIKTEEAKQQAEDAAALATAAVSHSQTIWDQLNKQKVLGLKPEVEAKLASAAAAVTAAAAVAKAAAAAAQVASNAASQAKMMADEAWISGRVDYPAFNTAPSVSNVGNNIGSATTPLSIIKVGDEGNFSSSILVAAKEAAKKRLEAASFASKRAENLDAIIKAAELAAAAVLQAGRIVAMGDPPSLAKLAEAGPEGYWRAPQIPPEHPNEECSTVGSIQATPSNAGRHSNDEPSKKKAKTASRGMSPLSREVFKDLEGGMPNFFASSEKDSRAQRDSRGSDLDKTIGVVAESETGPRPTSIISAQDDNTKGIGALKGASIREGSLVEVKKEGNGFKEAWFSANVLSVEKGKAFVSYAASKSGFPQLKEWVALEGDSNTAPRIRISPPVMDIQHEGTKKRSRGAVGDYAWSIGDKVDVWIKECWREGIITDKNKIDVTTITVHFPAEGDTSVVRAWHLRPTLIWQDGKWVESFSSRQKDPSHEGDTPQQKRLKLGGPLIEGSKSNDISKTFQLPGPERPEELQLLPLSDNDKRFNLGDNNKKDSKLDAPITVRSGLQKDGPRVVFGIPKPGKKKKFMEVSKHYVAESSNKPDKLKEKNVTPKNGGKEKQQGDLMTKIPKPGKPISSFGRTLPQKEKFPRSTLSTKSQAKKSASTDGSESEQEKQSKFGTVSSTDGFAQGSFVFSSAALSRNMFTSNARSERVKRGNRGPIASKSTKVAKDTVDAGKQIPEIAEPRRSNRRIQPTSRLLEGLQSSLVLPKFPSFGHDKGQRSHTRSTPKGTQ